MIKTSYKTRQQELLFNYLREMQGKHFTAEDVRAHFAKKEISIGIATIYRQLEKLVSEGKIQKYFIDEHSAACFEYPGEICNTDEQHFHLKCEVCGKGVTFGIRVSHSHRRSNRTWKPNVKRVKAIVDGSPKHVYACTRCLRSGKVTRAV